MQTNSSLNLEMKLIDLQIDTEKNKKKNNGSNFSIAFIMENVLEISLRIHSMSCSIFFLTMPVFSSYISSRKPSAVRLAQLAFNKRTDKIDALNGAIGNVTLPLHPVLQERMDNLGTDPEFSL